jgi:tyrosine-protein kinase Etk/Wzc
MNAEMTLWDYFRVIKRRMKIIVIVPLCALVAAWLYAQNLAPLYSSRALIEIRRNTIREGVGVTRSFVSSYDRASVTRLAGNKEVSILAARLLIEDPRRENRQVHAENEDGRLAAAIRATVRVSSVEQSNVIEMSAVGSEPTLLADYCNASARALIDFYEAERRRVVAELTDYLQSQIQRYDVRVRDLEDQLVAHRNRGRDMTSLGSSPEPRTRLADRLRENEEARGRLEVELTQLASVADVDALLPFLTAAAEVKLRDEYLEKRRIQEDLLNRLTDAHPRIQSVREEIAEISSRLKALLPVVRGREEVTRRRALERLALERDRILAERAMVEEAIAALPEHQREEGSLQRELGIATSVCNMFRQRLEDINFSLEIPSDRLELVEPAVPPAAPFYPNRKTIISIGLTIGVMLALALAFLIESLDTSITAMRDVERLLGKQILAVIPAIRIPDKRLEESPYEIRKDLLAKVPMLADQRSPAAEAYRTLRAVLQSRFFASGKKTLLVTSTTPQEGKTTTIVNLSLACADAGLKTVLVGANMRHPVIGRHFKIDRSRGLHDVLLGVMTPEEGLQSTGHENLSIIDSGTFARRPAELLARKEFGELLEWLKARFDVVLIDSPPTLPVADAATIAPKVDGVLLVYLVSVAPRDALLRCKGMIEEVGGEIVGVVFNDIWGASQADYAGYYYHQKYAADEFRRL